MPPRFAYWTIILEGKPTAFRAQQRDELVPTFKQLQTKHPDVVLKWFARGRLWESPEAAQAAQRAAGRERRAPEWRPGGEHRDPRARFKIPRDEKRSRFAAKLRRESRDRPPFEPTQGRPGDPSARQPLRGRREDDRGVTGAGRRPHPKGHHARGKPQSKRAGERLPDRREGPGADRTRDRPKTRNQNGAPDSRFTRSKDHGPDRDRDGSGRPFERTSPRNGARRSGSGSGPFEKKPGRNPHRGPGSRKPGGGRGGGGGPAR